MASKVITLPVNDPNAARAKLQEMLNKHKILFLVLGETDIAVETVRRADELTGGDINEPEWVIHAPKREDVVAMLGTLSNPARPVQDWDKPLAIAISISDTIRDMIQRDGKQPTFSRISDAILMAQMD